jgi:hypothetical protein
MMIDTILVAFVAHLAWRWHPWLAMPLLGAPLVSLPVTVLIFGGIYMLGSTYLEGKPVDYWSSLERASETLTTTGYGAYAPWRHPLMRHRSAAPGRGGYRG